MEAQVFPQFENVVDNGDANHGQLGVGADRDVLPRQNSLRAAPGISVFFGNFSVNNRVGAPPAAASGGAGAACSGLQRLAAAQPAAQPASGRQPGVPAGTDARGGASADNTLVLPAMSVCVTRRLCTPSLSGELAIDQAPDASAMAEPSRVVPLLS